MKEQQTRQVVQELEQLLAKAEEEATKARQVRDPLRDPLFFVDGIHGWIC